MPGKDNLRNDIKMAKIIESIAVKTDEKNSGGPIYTYKKPDVRLIIPGEKMMTDEELTELVEKNLSKSVKEEADKMDKEFIDAYKGQSIEMNIVLYPEPILRQRCSPVEEMTEEIIKFCQDLHLYTKKSRCLGLSAPQVGYPKQIIVVNEMIQGMEKRPHILINPVISNASGKSKYKEGCLSLPGIYAQVERVNSFDITYKDIEGKEHTERVEDVSKEIFGTIVQHEIDHLEGRLFIDILSSYENNRVIGKINKLRPRK